MNREESRVSNGAGSGTWGPDGNQTGDGNEEECETQGAAGGLGSWLGLGLGLG